jgi:hypothetical protein
VRELFERTWFVLCLTLGGWLRARRYSKTAFAVHNGNAVVEKRRSSYAPMLVWLGGPLMKLLNTGVRVLSQRDWEVRERQLYQSLYGLSVHTRNDRTLVLPRLGGETLATLLESSRLDESSRTRAIELAARALVDFHAAGFTHGDAMAENVLVDLEGDTARWFDFETLHDESRPMAWRRADDLRALVSTCLLRTAEKTRVEVLGLLLNAYGDIEISSLVAGCFVTSTRRALAFHLGQAALTFRDYRELGRAILLVQELRQPE